MNSFSNSVFGKIDKEMEFAELGSNEGLVKDSCEYKVGKSAGSLE